MGCQMLIRHRCGDRRCKYYKGINPYTNKHYCKAFHEGIPDDITNGNDDHLTIREGQTKPICFSLPNRNLVEPYPVELMDSYRGWGRDNLCATVHNIYLMSDDPEIKYWCRIAVKMIKNMAFALMDYREMFRESTWHRHQGIHDDNMQDWQFRNKSLYRGNNKLKW